MKYLPFALIAILVIGLIWFSVSRPDTENRSEETLRYESEANGFALDYPKDLTYQESDDGTVVFKAGADEKAELQVVTIANDGADSLETAVARELANLCSATSTSVSYTCEIDDLEPFRTTAGVSGYMLDLKRMASTTSTSTEAEDRGPFLIIPLRTNTTESSVLIIYPPLTLPEADIDSRLLQKMAKTVVLLGGNTPASTQTIEEYVKSVINDLSSEAAVPPVLGGTYYVTEIMAGDGKGVVSYEDGHVAHTADFTYSIDANGRISMNSFTVRP
jgi:hypothetical protein